MIEELMKETLTDVLSQGYTLHTNKQNMDGKETDIFYFRLFAPGNSVDAPGKHSRNIYGYIDTKGMTVREASYCAAYFLLGTLEGRGKVNIEKVNS